ncbi:MAG: hypothetical protein AB7N71_09270 [Phycisphaerae bacterium]
MTKWIIATVGAAALMLAAGCATTECCQTDNKQTAAKCMCGDKCGTAQGSKDCKAGCCNNAAMKCKCGDKCGTAMASKNCKAACCNQTKAMKCSCGDKCGTSMASANCKASCCNQMSEM